MEFEGNGFDVGWKDENTRNFGHVGFYWNSDGNLRIDVDSEHVSKEFVKKLLCQLVDESILVDRNKIELS